MYCKLGMKRGTEFRYLLVLIVAKCIVNNSRYFIFNYSGHVLIVAKCIVNLFHPATLSMHPEY